MAVGPLREGIRQARHLSARFGWAGARRRGGGRDRGSDPAPGPARPARVMVAKLGWGIAGCGWVARDYVGPAISASANGELVALYDPDPLSRSRAKQLLGAPCFDNLDAFLATPGLGAVYVAAPNHAHRQLVEAA